MDRQKVVNLKRRVVVNLVGISILSATDILNDYKPGDKFSDMTIQFSHQNNTQQTINLDWIQNSTSGSSITSYIVGSGNKFTVVVNTSSTHNGIPALEAEVYSGTIEATGIRGLYHAVFMIENNGNGAVIPNGSGRVFYDGDGFSDKTTPFKSAQLKSDNSLNNFRYFLKK